MRVGQYRMNLSARGDNAGDAALCQLLWTLIIIIIVTRCVSTESLVHCPIRTTSPKPISVHRAARWIRSRSARSGETSSFKHLTLFDAEKNANFAVVIRVCMSSSDAAGVTRTSSEYTPCCLVFATHRMRGQAYVCTATVLVMIFLYYRCSAWTSMFYFIQITDLLLVAYRRTRSTSAERSFRSVVQPSCACACAWKARITSRSLNLTRAQQVLGWPTVTVKQTCI